MAVHGRTHSVDSYGYMFETNTTVIAMATVAAYNTLAPIHLAQKTFKLNHQWAGRAATEPNRQFHGPVYYIKVCLIKALAGPGL